LQYAEPNHYATLGLDHRCTTDQIRAAYRLLAKQFHPDLNPNSAEAVAQTQQLNAAYAILSDPNLRRDYDESRKKRRSEARATKKTVNISQDAHLRIEELLRGTTLQIRVNDPANPSGTESYELIVPPETAPGTRFRVPRAGAFEGGFIIVRVRPRPDFRFKPRGSDLRCDLPISSQRATLGGYEMVQGVTGRVRVNIPRNIGRNEIIRVSGEGLPKPRGSRGDLLVRILYRPEVHISRTRR
jgi:curved DNA-binding protein